MRLESNSVRGLRALQNICKEHCRKRWQSPRESGRGTGFPWPRCLTLLCYSVSKIIFPHASSELHRPYRTSLVPTRSCPLPRLDWATLYHLHLHLHERILLVLPLRFVIEEQQRLSVSMTPWMTMEDSRRTKYLLSCRCGISQAPSLQRQ